MRLSRAFILLISGLLLLSITAFTGSFNKNKAHADFLNPDSSYILPPTNFVITGVWPAGANASTFTASWTRSDNAVSYSIYDDDVKIAAGLTATRYVLDAKDTSGSTYTVTATDTQGNESIPSNLASPIEGNFDPNNLPGWVSSSTPNAPTHLVATPQWNLGKPRIALSWQGDGSIQCYRVYRDGIQVADGLFDLTYFDSNVVSGSSHQYTVTGVNAFWPTNPESAMTAVVSATALSRQPSFSSTAITITKIIPNDDSVVVFFNPVPGATDYRVYNLSSLKTAKYAGVQDKAREADAAPTPYSVEMNNLSTGGADLIVEAVDKLGPFQKSDGFDGPGSALGSSVNGQGDPSDVPNVIARSLPFHVTMKPFSLTGSQAFFDTFRNEQPLVDVPTDPRIVTYDRTNYIASYFDTVKNDKWSITQYDTDTTLTHNFFMSGHFMDTIFDGGHNNNSSNVMKPNATADISGGKVLHVTMEVDAHVSGRRWDNIEIAAAGEALYDGRSPAKVETGYPTTSGNRLELEATSDGLGLDLYVPDPANAGHTKTVDINQITDWNDGQTSARVPFGGSVLGINGGSQDLDKRHRIDLYVSNTHYKYVETAPDGLQVSRERDFPVGITLPFSDVQVYYTHELYHTSNDRPEQMGYYPDNQYWYNYRPYSDERHWDNMGFEVLPSVASIPPNSSLLPVSETPNYISPSPTPTPTPFVALTYDLNKDGLVDLHDIVLAISYFTGRTPNAQALILWPPAGNPKLAGIIQVINACHVLGSCR